MNFYFLDAGLEQKAAYKRPLYVHLATQNAPAWWDFDANAPFVYGKGYYHQNPDVTNDGKFVLDPSIDPFRREIEKDKFSSQFFCNLVHYRQKIDTDEALYEIKWVLF